MRFEISLLTGKTSTSPLSSEEKFLFMMSKDILINGENLIQKEQEYIDTVFESVVPKLSSLGMSDDEISLLVG